MLQWFITFLEFAEVTEFNESSAHFIKKNSVGRKKTTKSYMRFGSHIRFELIFNVKAVTDKNDAKWGEDENGLKIFNGSHLFMVGVN